MSVTYRTPEATASPKVGRLVEVLDRFFVLISTGFFLLLPTSGWASVMFASWYDQRRDLAALRSVIADGHAQAVADNLIGPAYIAAGAIVHYVLGLGAEDSLVFLTRAGYVLSIACGVLLVRLLVRSLTAAPPMVSLAAQFGFVALVFAAGTWHWSDVPWSHFFAALLAVALYAVRFVPTRLSVISAGAAGVVLALLWLTRSFELLAVLAAWAITLALFALLRLRDRRALRVVHLVSGAVAFVTTTAAVYVVTGKRDLFFLYGGSLGQQSGNVRSAEVAETPTLTLSLVPTKLVQLFVEPCFDSLCAVSDYSGRASLSPLLTEEAGNLRLWSLPLGVQLPSLLLLPLCLLVVGALVIVAARHRTWLDEQVRGLRLLVEMSLASAGLVLGYSASTLTGPAHLRYGFARDFLLPALLTGIVAVSLLSAGIWLLLSRRSRARGPSPEFAFAILVFLGSASLVVALAYARANGIPRIDSRHLAAVTYTATCRGDACDVAIGARTTSGDSASIPEASVLTFGCGSNAPRFTVYENTPTAGVHLVQACRDPRLVAAWPTVMGLPPGSFELAAVQVRNA